jgi:Ca-activated chloride channel family protein
MKTIIFLLLVNMPMLINASIKAEFEAEKANSLYKKGDFEKAKEIYENAIKKDEKNDKIKFNLGNTYYRKREFEEAIKTYEEIKDEKIKIKAMYNQANSYAMKNEIDKAIEMYKNIILKDPSNKDAKYNLELLLKRKKSSSSSSNSKNNQDKNDKNKSGASGSDKNDKQDQNNDKNKDKENQNEDKKQAERFLDMMKNIEKNNIKNINSQKANYQGIKNDFDW